jgi:RNA polymerase sigma factor (sigma-70 family)
VITEEAILEGCIAGKRHSQKQLYDRYAAEMLSVCRRYARSRDEAEDLLQEGFVKVFSNIRSFRGEGSLAGWIKRIMINLAINQTKKNKRVPYMEDIEEIHETEIVPEEVPAELPVDGNTMMEWIHSLPEGYRMVFNLYVFEEMSHKAIGEMLEISENTSKTQLLKARRWLQKKVNEYAVKKRFAINHERK